MSISSYKTDYSLQESYTNFQCPLNSYRFSNSPAMSHNLPSGRGSHTFSTRNSSGHSTPTYYHSHDVKYTEGRGEPQFPSIEMQMGIINGMNAHDLSKNSIIGKIRMLEDENTVTKRRNQCLFSEKEIEVEKRIKLEKKVAELEKDLQEERAKIPAERENSSTKNEETSTTKITSSDEGVQVWSICRACRRELQSQENKEPVVTITKLELENLEKDMMSLRDNVLSTEETLNRAKKREQNYREQIARLFVEADSAQTLCKTRLEEIRTLTQTISDKEQEVKNLQKKMTDMGKLIVKLNKHQRNLEESCQLGNEFNLEVSDKEQKWIEDIERRLNSTKNKQRSKDKTPSSQQTSPRKIKITEHIKES